MIGAYGPWAAGLTGQGPARLSFRQPRFQAGEIDAWRDQARERLRACLLQPDSGGVPKAQVQHQLVHDGLHIEHLSWQLPYGPPTEAVFLKPAGAHGRLPAVLGLHDHGGNKYFGWRKIAQIGDQIHPMMKEHRDQYYGGVSWANELAKRGFAVLVHDAFAFASRRVRVGDLPPVVRKDLKEVNPESEEEIKAYNQFAADHEHLMSKSLLLRRHDLAGRLHRRRPARARLPLLARRRRSGPRRLRGPLRRRPAHRLPGRPRRPHPLRLLRRHDDDLARLPAQQVLIRTPGWSTSPASRSTSIIPRSSACECRWPTLVQNDNEDQLFTIGEMRRADSILGEVYAKAGAADRYKCTFYPGPHKFDRPMQAEAFAWFERWLKA